MNYKVKKREKTENRKLTEAEINEWKNKGNETEDPKKIIRRFVPQLRKRMGFDTVIAKEKEN